MCGRKADKDNMLHGLVWTTPETYICGECVEDLTPDIVEGMIRYMEIDTGGLQNLDAALCLQR
jgi:hypothetical protein